MTCKCGQPAIQGQAKCRACHAAYMREWRKSNPLTDEQKKRGAARSYAKVYLKRGKIDKQGCAICGAPAEMHHHDYDEPLRVVWLCRQHHLLHHWLKDACDKAA